MKEIVQYTIVEASGSLELVRKVNAQIQSGWQPFGPAILVYRDNHSPHEFYAQTMGGDHYPKTQMGSLASSIQTFARAHYSILTA